MAYPTPSLMYNNNHNQHHQYNTLTAVEHPMSATHTITNTAPVTPMRFRLAMPRKIKPMCATLELPISRLRSR